MQRNRIVVGIDEVGVGALYGPIVMAATANVDGWSCDQVRDSKVIKSEKKRQKLAEEIHRNMMWAYWPVQASEIDCIGTEAALEHALASLMKKMFDQLAAAGFAADCNGFDFIVDGDGREVDTEICRVLRVPRADATVFEVSAASIVAKHARDQWVHEMLRVFPEHAAYGLASNKGYGTAAHIEALIQKGPTFNHRRAFVETALRTARKRRQEDVASATTAAPIGG